MQPLLDLLSSGTFLTGWILVSLICVAIVLRDLSVNNSHLMSLMKWVWGLTVLYSGPIGLAVYWWSGRKEIRTDSLLRRGFRSVAHCYSGCGMGEITGVLIATALLGLGTWPTAVLSFALAYAFGFALTVGPLIQGGESPRKALRDALLSETPSITVMELVALGIGLTLNKGADLHEPIYWTSIIVSLSCGLIAAWPVNVALIHFGVKEGMMDPRMTHHDHGGHGGHGGGHGGHDHGHHAHA